VDGASGAAVSGEAEPTRVVGAAILDAGGRLLAAQRSTPPALAGRWELPGGKVENGEDEQDALVRECREELGVEVALGARVGGDWPIGDDGVLRVWLARVVTGEPRALEHSAVRWLPSDGLFSVPWLPADLPPVRAVERLLPGAGASPRGTGATSGPEVCP
jgi:8-oxo-dGTP diphosphatase